MTGDKLAARIRIAKILYYKEGSGSYGWGIVLFNTLKYLEENEVFDAYSSVAKGVMPKVAVGGEYELKASEVMDEKYGRQYNIQMLKPSQSIDDNDTQGQRQFLKSLFTERQVGMLYDKIENPYTALYKHDIETLTKAKGVGQKVAERMCAKFQQNLEHSRIKAGLAVYGLSDAMIKKLTEKYESPDVAMDMVRHHPYELTGIKGFGWKKCDWIAQKVGIPKDSPERVAGYINYYLKDKADDGFTYVRVYDQLIPDIYKELGDDLPEKSVKTALRNMGYRLQWSNNYSLVGLRHYINLENNIAKKLIQLRDAENPMSYEGWETVIRDKEKEQGWEYTEQQYEGIKAVLENQVVIISGYGGTGKSSIVAGVLAVLNGYKCVQCALSGRAASRLSEITGQEGYTIHRLLGYPKGNGSDKFYYNESNPLDADMVIVDEISMVDGELFWDLIRALKEGTKLILLGDVGQLESIGCSNIANDLIAAPEIKSVVLDKIHRQAQSSAIITDSIMARKGKQIVEKNFVGVKEEGKMHDLTYDCYEDSHDTFPKIMKWAEKLKNDGVSVNDLQVIVPIKDKVAGTWNLNHALQDLFNPEKEGSPQLTVKYGSGKENHFRVGDKVMNVKNNYHAAVYSGQWETDGEQETNEDKDDYAVHEGSTEKDDEDEEDEWKEYEHDTEEKPIFNGNIGTIVDINDDKKEMIVDFAEIGKILITEEMLKSIVLGYATTVHKCQGSEYKYVIFGMDYSSYILLSRQLVYTAITRAKEHCYIVAQNSALRYAVAQNKVSNKQTILRSSLSNEDRKQSDIPLNFAAGSRRLGFRMSA